jgi:hypothetical protein
MLAEEQIYVAHRPTPRHGWTQAREASEERQEPKKDAAVLRPRPSKVDSTVSLVSLEPIAGSAPSAPIALKKKAAKPTQDEPADALPWTPSAATPGVFTGPRALRPNSKASASSTASCASPARAVRNAEATHDLSLADLSFAQTQPENDGDKTEVDSVDELSLPEMDSADGATLETRTSARVDAGSEPSAATRETERAPRRHTPRAAWLFIATCGLMVLDWSVRTSTVTREATITLTPPSLAAAARLPIERRPGPSDVGASLHARHDAQTGVSGSGSSHATPSPEAPATQAVREDVVPSVASGANAESLETSDEESDDDEPELDAAHKTAAVRARELANEGRALQKRKKYRPAGERYREALRVYPGYPRALRGLVQLAIVGHEGKRAVALAKQLLRERPGQVANLVLLGDAYAGAGKRKEAREAWQAAARKGSTTARARLKR